MIPYCFRICPRISFAWKRATNLKKKRKAKLLKNVFLLSNIFIMHFKPRWLDQKSRVIHFHFSINICKFRWNISTSTRSSSARTSRTRSRRTNESDNGKTLTQPARQSTSNGLRPPSLIKYLCSWDQLSSSPKSESAKTSSFRAIQFSTNRDALIVTVSVELQDINTRKSGVKCWNSFERNTKLNGLLLVKNGFPSNMAWILLLKTTLKRRYLISKKTIYKTKKRK